MASSAAKKAKLEPVKLNFELSSMITELADFERNVNRNIYKYNAYRKAARSILEHPTKIASSEEASGLEGVGKQILLKIDQYLASGAITKLDKVRESDDAKSINELIRVTGIGPAAAQKLVKEGIHTLEQLRVNEDKLNHHQCIGLKYVEDFEKRIPRSEMMELKDFILKEIELIDVQYVATVCGSFRRGADSSGDIDILITHPSFTSSDKKPKKGKAAQVDSKALIEAIVTRLEAQQFVTDTLALGDTKFMGVCKLSKDGSLHRRIDIRTIPHDQYYCGILYFTGSDMFNKNMRTIALAQKFTLNEYSLRYICANGMPGKAVEINSEKDVFDHLKMEYQTPEQRNL